jgi:glycosyltransferase involved in cell wall biosynthesis
LEAYLLDDGSTDGTAEAVKARHPQVEVLRGDGTLFWNGGMRRAFAAVLEGDYDHYLWLNDDTLLYPGALENLLQTHRRVTEFGVPASIVVGSTRDPDTGDLTYGGLSRESRLRPLRFTPVRPGEGPRECETMNGNCVLVPREVAMAVGNLDGAFTHGMGDIDYAFRAREAGCRVWVAPGYAGSCSRNLVRGSWRDPGLPLRARLSKLLGPKGLPPREWGVFVRRHAGPLWGAYWVLPYIRLTGSALRQWITSPRNGHSLDEWGAAGRRVALLTNIVAPYRVPVYRRIGEVFDLRVFYSGEEENRSAWGEPGTGLDGIPVKRYRGLTLRLPKLRERIFYDYGFVHVNPGYLLDLLKLRPRAVVTNEMGFRTVSALLYGTLFRRPVWVSWGGTLHTERGVGRARKILRGVIVRWARRWISYGETSTEYLRSLGVPRERVLQVQNCVDEGMYRRPERPAVHIEPGPVLLYVGQMIGRKGASELLKVAARLQEEGYIFSLLLVGGGPEKEELEALAGRLGLENVRFYPPQPPERMPAFYLSADYVVFPTLEDVWGLVVNEALWSGVPVISSVYAGCAEELLPERNLFDPTDADGFADALRRTLDGEIEPADTSRLRTCSEVGDMIVEDIRRGIGSG